MLYVGRPFDAKYWFLSSENETVGSLNVVQFETIADMQPSFSRHDNVVELDRN